MFSDIRIVEKPDWISWNEIRDCLFRAHEENRAMGINMSYYQWPAEKIRESLGEKGVMFVALNGNKLIGTAAIGEKQGKLWYAKGKCAYVSFDGIIPEFAGKGVFRLLDAQRENWAKNSGYEALIFDTHALNIHRQKIAEKIGYRYVRFFRAISKDHFSVVMVKWLNEKPFSDTFIKRRFYLSKILTIFQYNSRGYERSSISSYICRKVNARIKVV